MNDSLINSYFAFLAQAFPVQCASDDFDAYPRAQAAAGHYHDLDDFDPEAMARRADKLRQFKNTFASEAVRAETALERAKYKTLVLCSRAALLDIESVKSWQRNPLLYLRVAFNGLDQAMHRNAERSRRLSRLASRVAALPRLFAQARENLRDVPARFKYAARVMAEDGTTHLLQIAGNKEIFPLIEDALQALKTFKLYLETLPEVRDIDVPGPDMSTVLSDRFGYAGDPDALYDMARRQQRQAQRELEKLAKDIDPDSSWREIAVTPLPLDRRGELTDIFQQQIENLRHFFVHTSLSGLYPDCPLKLLPTPVHARSVRTMASYTSGLDTAPMETSHFYVSAHAPSKEDTLRLGHRFRREAPFIAAHETYPGHHLIDCYRRLNPCPVASQVELPLFYEGWATFAESLLPEYGFISSPLDLFAHYRRRLWKAAEAIVDIGLNTRRLSENHCLGLLEDAGFTLAEARRQVGLARLNPGYQLCGLAGAMQIDRLRTDFAVKLGLREFYKALLDTGQMPFHLLREVLEEQVTLAETAQPTDPDDSNGSGGRADQDRSTV